MRWREEPGEGSCGPERRAPAAAPTRAQPLPWGGALTGGPGRTWPAPVSGFPGEEGLTGVRGGVSVASPAPRGDPWALPWARSRSGRSPTARRTATTPEDRPKPSTPLRKARGSRRGGAGRRQRHPERRRADLPARKNRPRRRPEASLWRRKLQGPLVLVLHVCPVVYDPPPGPVLPGAGVSERQSAAVVRFPGKRLLKAKGVGPVTVRY